MKHLIKKVSLENFKSRLPGLIPSIKERWAIDHNNVSFEYKNYSEARVDAVNNSYDVSKIYSYDVFAGIDKNEILSSNTNGNYGLIVSDIEIPRSFINKITDYTDIFINIPKNDYDFYDIREISYKNINNLFNEGETCYFIYRRNIYSIECDKYTNKKSIDEIVSSSTLHKFLTYSTLKKWYHFFNDYYKLLNGSESNTKFESAYEYYTYKIDHKNEETAEEYRKIDELFKARGGNEFYNWIQWNCIPKYHLPKKYIEANGFSYLYYPEAVKFFAWLKERYLKYNYLLDNANKYTFTISVDEAKGLVENGEHKFKSEYLGEMFSDPYLYTINDNNTFTFNKTGEILTWPKINAKPKAYNNEASEVYCLTAPDCCDCMLYFKRGGNDIYYHLKSWLNSVKSKPNATNSASIVLPISFSVNIDDIGQFSIFSNEYSEKTDYSSTLGTAQKNYQTTGGTVTHRPIITNKETGDIFVDNNVYMIKDNNNQTGFIQNEFNENIFHRDDWVDYTTYYINKNPEKFVSKVSYLAYKRNGEVVYDPTMNDMLESYELVKPENGLVYIEGEIFILDKTKYTIFKGLKNSLMNGLIFPVTEISKDVFYTIINNKPYYSIERDGSFYFNFTKTQKCVNNHLYDSEILPKGNLKVEALNYKGSIHLLEYDENDEKIVKVEREGITYIYPKLDGYVVIDSITYFVKKGRLVQFTEYTEISDSVKKAEFKEFEGDWKKIIVKNDEVQVLYDYKTQPCDIISGYTDSKLSLLKQTKILTDDLGNEMPGYYEFSLDYDKEKVFIENGFDEAKRKNSKYNQPYNGCLLDFYYKVGNTSSISKNEYLTDDDVVNKQYFDGNILQSMKIYCIVDGVADEEHSILLDNDDEETDNTDVLGAIEKCLESASGNDIELHCIFKYNIGAILYQRTKMGTDGMITYNGYELAKNMNHGVEYVEDDILELSDCVYEQLDGTKFILKYYGIRQTVDTHNLNDYNDQKVNINLAKFYSKIVLLRKNDKTIYVNQKEFNPKYGFNQLNNMVAAPIFMKEHNFGVTELQNTNTDIYLDRGINKAFDKHLRLQEIKTLDSLIQYQNGAIFNIIEN